MLPTRLPAVPALRGRQPKGLLPARAQPRSFRVRPVRSAAQDSCDAADADQPSTSGRSSLDGLEPIQLDRAARGAGALIRNRRAAVRSLEPLVAVALPAWLLGGAAEYLDLSYPVWMPVATGAMLGATYAVMYKVFEEFMWRQPARPLNVIVTGGSKGLGKALARELLEHGDRVLLTSRTQEGADAAVRELREEVGENAQVFGCACDVASAEEVARLSETAQRLFGQGAQVDAWINNAGYSGSFKSFADSNEEQIQQVVLTNLLGTLMCTRHAMRLFEAQPSGGHVFNMDGAGADGFATPKYAAYGSTKCGIAQFTRSVQQELKGARTKVHTVSPGMILTDLLLEGATTANKQAFNILCEQPETVAAFLVPRMRTVVARNQTASYIKFLTPASALGRLVTAPLRIGKFFDAQGNPVYPDERSRIFGKHSRVTARRIAKARSRAGGLRFAFSASVLACLVALLADAGAANAGPFQ